MAPVAQMVDMNATVPNNTILFDVSKKEIFTPNNGFKSWSRKIKNNWKVVINKDEISKEKLSSVKVLVLASPREKFKVSEFEAMKSYLENGGSILAMLSEGGEQKTKTNLNFMLEEYGIMGNTDSVIRTSYYKYLHPKEALIPNGVLNREINYAAGKKRIGGSSLSDADVPHSQSCLSFVYPYGATLAVDKRSSAVLSTGSVCLPLFRPICAFHSTKNHRGKLCVIGSCHIFNDQYIDKEENAKLLDVITKWLSTDDIKLNAIDAEEPEINDYNYVPDTIALSERLRVCLQEGEEVPNDFTHCFQEQQYNLDTSMLPATLRAFKELNVKHETLTLISPQFETPLPPLEPAVFPPQFRELPGPTLDLFDLDEAFSSEHARLAQLAHKCSDEDLEYFVRECGDILGVTNKLSAESRDAKHILEYIFAQVVEFKKLNQDTEMDETQDTGDVQY
ncbi:intraflagellar transport protein 52 homolog isoform X1 [Hydra vulgaris]|uniref:intraflagellar transport protein 52 homolog isoform X1 n=1 Tax=Hydra vulgaris TaxID=6087 RepID=UPI001F5ED50F|nr:intraflagellar transport protein 52 homolog [Hydra vulgaris]